MRKTNYLSDTNTSFTKMVSLVLVKISVTCITFWGNILTNFICPLNITSTLLTWKLFANFYCSHYKLSLINCFV